MSTENNPNEALNKTDVSYSEFMEQQGYDEAQIFADYQKALEEENKKQEENSREVLSKIKPNVTIEYFDAINHFLHDEENGIWGDLKIVKKPIGEWQDEYQDEEDETNYWNILKGMYVNQSCGYSGDDYNGTLEIKINDNQFLRCSFSL
jgi:hypothetical protein